MFNSLFNLSPFGSSQRSKASKKPLNMADTKTYTISTLTRGMCLETRPNAISTGKYDSSGNTQAQLWALEQSDDGKSVAFRSVANGQYLRSTAKGDAQKVQTGAKSWWTLESGDSPGTWWLKNNEFGNYLNNYYGNQTPNNKVQMWSSNLQGWNYTLMWYITDIKAAASFSLSEGADSTSAKQMNEDLEAKEKLLKDRENKVAAAEKEAVEREKTVAERESKAEAREKVLDERTRKLETSEQTVAAKGSGASGSAGEAGQEAELQRQLADTQRELDEVKAIQEKQAERLDQRQSAHYQGASSTNGTTPGTSDDEANRLRQRVQELEAQIAGTTPSPLTWPAGSVERERAGLKPIVVQRGFGFLPRLTDSRVNVPLLTRPSKVLPRRDLPPKINPPANPPSMTTVR